MGIKIKRLFLAKKWEILGSLLLLAVFVVPVLSFAGHETKIYVDDDATGVEDGSSSNPYSTIGEALDNSDENTEIHIRAGTYKENIEIPKGVEIFGSDKDDVIIKADDDDDPVIEMKHKTKIDNVTIKGGKYGIKIGKNSRVAITDCVIKDNKKDGIKIKRGDVKDKKKVSISGNEIKDNGRSGIYSEKRRLVIINNEILNNDSDGIDIEKGSKAWIEGNKVKDNDGSGIKVKLDKSEIWIKNNTLRNNNREGIEVNASGKPGTIEIKKSKLYKNDRYGIASVQRGDFSSSVWEGLIIKDNNKFWENKIGNISLIIKL